MGQRHDIGSLEGLSPPSRERIYTDFSLEIVVEPTSREVWIFGQGDVEWQLDNNDSMSTWTVDASSASSIFVTAKIVKRFGTGTTVSKIVVYD